MVITFDFLREKFSSLQCVKGNVRQISGLNQLDGALSQEASFLVDHRYRSLLKQCSAAVLITNIEEFPYAQEEFSGCIWHTPDPLSVLGGLATVLEQERFGEDERWSEAGIHSTAIVEKGAQVHSSASVGPYCVVRKGASIGVSTSLLAYVYVGCHAKIEQNCVIGVGASILAYTKMGAGCRVMPGAVIGSQGFGVLRNRDGKNTRIPQLGQIVIGPQSRIGCNTTMDRGTFGETQLGARAYLDNLTQVGHNAQAGEDFIMCSQSGLTGSSKVGNRVTIGALAGIKDHVQVTDDVTVTAMTGVIKDWMKPRTLLKGYPAAPLTEYLKQQSAFRKLPQLMKRVQELEREVEQLRDRLNLSKSHGDSVELEHGST